MAVSEKQPGPHTEFLYRVVGPIVIMALPGPVTDAALASVYEERVLPLLDGKEPLVLHLDTLPGGTLSASQRRFISDFFSRHRDALSRQVVCCAVVAPNSLLRGILTAVNWLAPPPFLQKPFTDRTEAALWIQATFQEKLGRQLDAPGLILPVMREWLGERV